MSSRPAGPEWTLTATAFRVLVERMGAGGADGAAEYELVRRRLIALLDSRGAAFPERAADETLDRVARKLEAGEEIGNLRAYAYGVARHVLLEGERRDRRERFAHAEFIRADPPDSARAERRVACLEKCLGELPAESRELIRRYHECGSADRPRLAERLGVSYGGLRTRAHRIRNELAACLARCLDREGGDR